MKIRGRGGGPAADGAAVSAVDGSDADAADGVADAADDVPTAAAVDGGVAGGFVSGAAAGILVAGGGAGRVVAGAVGDGVVTRGVADGVVAGGVAGGFVADEAAGGVAGGNAGAGASPAGAGAARRSSGAMTGIVPSRVGAGFGGSDQAVRCRRRFQPTAQRITISAATRTAANADNRRSRSTAGSWSSSGNSCRDQDGILARFRAIETPNRRSCPTRSRHGPAAARGRRTGAPRDQYCIIAPGPANRSGPPRGTRPAQNRGSGAPPDVRVRRRSTAGSPRDNDWKENDR